MKHSRYFDHAATTPLDPVVLQEMLPYLHEVGNAHSLHTFGRRAAAAVQLARERFAEAIGASDPDEITFTSGATEANAWILQNFPNLVASPFEHSSLRDPIAATHGVFLGHRGYELIASPPGTSMIAVMDVNNETGARLTPPPEDTELPWHADLTQTLGKVPLPGLTPHFASFSGHKIGGPQGVGVLWNQSGQPLEPLLRGGGQEGGRRSGTVNVAGCVGMGLAALRAVEAQPDRYLRVRSCRAALLDELRDAEGWQTLDALPEAQSPWILAIAWHGLEAQPLLEALDIQGFAVSSGAACSATRPGPSVVVRALGLEEAWAHGVIRISFGPDHTPDDAVLLARTLKKAVISLRSLR